jgi:uncharacterized protein (TIGR03437 family)
MKIPYVLLLFVSMSVNAATVVAVGYSSPTSITVAPGQIVTFFVSGIGATLTGPVRANTAVLPNALAGIWATLDSSSAIPIVAVEPVATCAGQTQPGCGSYTAITVQIPFDLSTRCPGIADIEIFPVAVSFAENGTVVAIYAVGLGKGALSVVTGQAASSPIPVPTAIAYDFQLNAGPSQPLFTVTDEGVFSPRISPVFSGMTPGSVGLYQINVIIPTPPQGTALCDPAIFPSVNSNLAVNVGAQGGFDGVGICVLPTS